MLNSATIIKKIKHLHTFVKKIWLSWASTVVPPFLEATQVTFDPLP